jgi:hypothetical protein
MDEAVLRIILEDAGSGARAGAAPTTGSSGASTSAGSAGQAGVPDQLRKINDQLGGINDIRKLVSISQDMASNIDKMRSLAAQQAQTAPINTVADKLRDASKYIFDSALSLTKTAISRGLGGVAGSVAGTVAGGMAGYRQGGFTGSVAGAGGGFAGGAISGALDGGIVGGAVGGYGVGSITGGIAGLGAGALSKLLTSGGIVKQEPEDKLLQSSYQNAQDIVRAVVEMGDDVVAAIYEQATKADKLTLGGLKDLEGLVSPELLEFARRPLMLEQVGKIDEIIPDDNRLKGLGAAHHLDMVKPGDIAEENRTKDEQQRLELDKIASKLAKKMADEVGPTFRGFGGNPIIDAIIDMFTPGELDKTAAEKLKDQLPGPGNLARSHELTDIFNRMIEARSHEGPILGPDDVVESALLGSDDLVTEDIGYEHLMEDEKAPTNLPFGRSRKRKRRPPRLRSGLQDMPPVEQPQPLDPRPIENIESAAINLVFALDKLTTSAGAAADKLDAIPSGSGGGSGGSSREPPEMGPADAALAKFNENLAAGKVGSMYEPSSGHTPLGAAAEVDTGPLPVLDLAPEEPTIPPGGGTGDLAADILLGGESPVSEESEAAAIARAWERFDKNPPRHKPGWNTLSTLRKEHPTAIEEMESLDILPSGYKGNFLSIPEHYQPYVKYLRDAGKYPPGFAQGGWVGKGTDTIPAWLSPGEFVVNAQDAAANRGLLEFVNKGNARHMAEGGSVAPRTGAEKIGSVGNVVGSLINPSSDPSSSLKGMADIANEASKALGSVNPVAGALVGAFASLVSSVDATASKYGEYNAEIATAQAEAEVRQTMGEMRRAEELAPELSDFVRAQSDVQQKAEDIKTAILGKVVPVVTRLLEVVELFMDVGSGVGGAIGELLEPLAGIASAAGELIGMKREDRLPSPDDPTSIILVDRPGFGPGNGTMQVPNL